MNVEHSVTVLMRDIANSLNPHQALMSAMREAESKLHVEHGIDADEVVVTVRGIKLGGAA